MGTDSVNTGAPQDDAPNEGSGRPYVAFKGYWGAKLQVRTIKTMPFEILSQKIARALASCSPPTGNSSRPLLFEYDIQNDRWVATTFIKQIRSSIGGGVLIGATAVGFMTALFFIQKLAYVLYQRL